jgi:hypothetical protein
MTATASVHCSMARTPVLPLSRRKRFITRLHHCGPPELN